MRTNDHPLQMKLSRVIDKESGIAQYRKAIYFDGIGWESCMLSGMPAFAREVNAAYVGAIFINDVEHPCFQPIKRGIEPHVIFDIQMKRGDAK